MLSQLFEPTVPRQTLVNALHSVYNDATKYNIAVTSRNHEHYWLVMTEGVPASVHVVCIYHPILQVPTGADQL